MTSHATGQHRVRVLIACLGAFALLTLTLSAQSIWWDEGISLHLADLSWREIIDNRAANIHPPLYFFLLKVWLGVVGNTPFTGRYLSVLATTLLPAAAYAFLRPRLGGRSARSAALLVGFAPPFVVYGQETRAYALLPLGVIALWALVWPIDSGTGASLPRSMGQSRRHWLVLGLVQGTLLLLHYAGALAVGVAAIGFAYRWVRERRAGHRPAAQVIARVWVRGAIVTGLCILPWVELVLTRGLGGMSRQAGLGNALSEPIPAGYVAALVGVFHTVGLPEAVGRPYLLRLTLLIGVVMALASVVAHVRSPRRGAIAGLLALWLAPFAAAPVIWTLSPQAHPRYLYPFVVGGWLGVAALIGLRAVPKLWRLGLLALVVAGNLLGLATYFGDEDVARSDVRAAARFIRTTAAEGDIALVPYTDWSLAQYEVAPAAIRMVPEVVGDADGETHLPLDGTPGGRIFVLDYPRGALDPRGAVRAALTAGSVLVERREFHGVVLEIYDRRGVAALPECRSVVPVCVAGADLCLTGLASVPAPVSGAAAPTALCWDKGDDEIGRYGVAVRLYGPSGDFIAADHDLLLDAALAPTDLWPAQASASYHSLPLPVGALPLPHRIEISLYDAHDPGRSVVLTGPELSGPAAAATVGQIVPALSPWQEVSRYGLQPPPAAPTVQLTSQLRLSGSRLDREVVRPGETFYVSLAWGLTPSSADPETPRLELVCDGSPIAMSASVIGSVMLPAGRPALETMALSIPPDVPTNVCPVLISAEDLTYQVGEIAVEGVAHLFAAPPTDYETDAAAGSVASLVGLNLEPGAEPIAGAPVTVTLVWRALDDAALHDLKVFVHLIAEDGRLVAQDDAKPAGWSRPTSSWLPNEVIIDEHVLTWHDTDVAGTAYLSVGFYDEVTGERQVWSTGGDAYNPPIDLRIVSP